MKFFEKPGPELADRVPPGQHLAKGFPVLTYGPTPEINQAEWRLKLSGLVTEKSLTWDELMALPQQEFTADFHCVTTWSKLDVTWRGVKVTDLLATVDVDPQAVHVMAHCYGGYTTNVAMADFARPENFLAHTLEGDPLPPDHGGPLRLVVPHLYAWKSAKWLSGLEFLPEPAPGFWERNGYHMRGEPWAEERYGDL
ncbi:sulfite oxidase-like oxidoreductase [Leptothoe kymatousa]|uniref:Sulfite oxidase-like oxidoreductase n=1 Tax=Leptothoe kymatousa TAU-MAC 1615 TaxID=2364775 RepID=A0ABS5Y2J6_9CYAN|nr:sulfite oxidase-like oxidoreductase [Leptothoe kymatousa]MBT9311728.1 sulfite oxidase-like oxidoreductase [Leptothoe kymatousa TAU-MAC 1615]